MRIGFMLTERQIEVFKNWQNSLDRRKLEAACEEDCVVTSPFKFVYWPTGLGDHIEVRFGEDVLHLSIDDDGVGEWPSIYGRKYA